MRTPKITVAILLAMMLIASACSASEVQVTRVVEIVVTMEVPVEIRHEVVVTREVEVPVEVVRKVEVTREVISEIIREMEVTREILVTVEVTPTPTPIPSYTPTPTVDVRDVDYVRDVEVPTDFVDEAANIAVAYCDDRTFSASIPVLRHFDNRSIGGWQFYGFDAGTDECRADVLAAMAVRSKLMSLMFTRYIAEADGFLQCYDRYNSYSPKELRQKCPYLEELYPARHLPEYDREKLIVMFEDQPPEYPLDYLLTQDELWARGQIWRSLIRYFHFHCMRKAEEAQGRVLLLFDRVAYIGTLPNAIEDDGFSSDLILPGRGWGGDGPGVGLCSAYDIKIRAEYVMWEYYDVIYFGYLATGVPPAGYGRIAGSVNFTEDLATMRANPPEIPNRFAAD